MNQYIQVTRHLCGSKYLVNVNAIAYITDNQIHLISKERIVCKESYNDIVRLINHP